MRIQSKLERVGFVKRGQQNNIYNKDYRYTDMEEAVEKNSELKRRAEVELFEKEHAPYDFDREIEMPFLGTGYDLSQVKKGNPEDGGHTFLPINQNLNPNDFIPQLHTWEGGDEVDVLTRESLLAINKYNDYYPYSYIDTEDNIDAGQYFVPGDLRNWPKDAPQDANSGFNGHSGNIRKRR